MNSLWDNLRWQPAMPLWLVVIGVMGLITMAIYASGPTLRVRPIMTVFLLILRGSAVMALAIVLLGPSMAIPHIALVHRAKLTILLDTSASMWTADCHGATRLDWALSHWLTNKQLDQLTDHGDWDLFGFDRRVQPLGRMMLRQPAQQWLEGPATHLVESLGSVINELPPTAGGSALLVLSDGIDTTGAEIHKLAELARRRGVPMHTVCLGGLVARRDLALEAQPSRDRLILGQSGELLVKVHQVGYPYAATTLRLESETGSISHPLTFDGKRSVALKLPIIADQPGLREYQLNLEPLEGEGEQANNHVRVFVEVLDKPIKVLLLEGRPHWDTKYLAQALRRDERVELVQFTELLPGKLEVIHSRAQDSAVATIDWREHLDGCDVLIMGQRVEHHLDDTAAQRLVRAVSDGGLSLILARGQPYDPSIAGGQKLHEILSVIEPVRWADHIHRDLSLSLTDAGRKTAWLTLGAGGALDQAMAHLPGYVEMREIMAVKPATQVLWRAKPPEESLPPMPALVCMPYGRGHVAAVLGQGLWRWRLLAARDRSWSGLYDNFWSSLVRYLALGVDFQPGRQWTLRLSSSQVRLGDPLRLEALCRFIPTDDPQLTARIVNPDGREHIFPLERSSGHEDRWSAKYNPKYVGVHHLSVESPVLQPPRLETKFATYDVEVEKLDRSARPLVLRELADSTGGRFMLSDRPVALERLLPRSTIAEGQNITLIHAWNRVGVLWALLAWLSVEWVVRRRMGWP